MEKPALKLKNVNERKELETNYVHCNNVHDKRKKSTNAWQYLIDSQIA